MWPKQARYHQLLMRFKAATHELFIIFSFVIICDPPKKFSLSLSLLIIVLSNNCSHVPKIIKKYDISKIQICNLEHVSGLLHYQVFKMKLGLSETKYKPFFPYFVMVWVYLVIKFCLLRFSSGLIRFRSQYFRPVNIIVYYFMALTLLDPAYVSR